MYKEAHRHRQLIETPWARRCKALWLIQARLPFIKGRKNTKEIERKVEGHGQSLILWNFAGIKQLIPF